MNHFFDWGDDEGKAVYVGLEMAESRDKAMSKVCYGRGFGLKEDECEVCAVKAVWEAKSKAAKLEHEAHLRNVLEASNHAKAMSEAKLSAYNRPFGRYFKDVSNLNAIDVYKVLELFGVKSHALGHAVKKILVAGARGGKDEAQDIREAIAALERHLEILGGK